MSNEIRNKSGVTIIVCTNKVDLMDNIFSNYENQLWEDKELIIILNNDSLNLLEWINMAQEHAKDISVYQLPQRFSLGKCLNFGVHRARYDYIAKFDDDDYYGPAYLTEAMEGFTKTNADVVGKRTAFMYLIKSKQLRLRFPRNEEKCVNIVVGGTIIAKKNVFRKVQFADLSLGEDVNFLRRCRRNGFRILSTSRYNYTYIRRNDGSHNWKPESRYLMKTSKKILKTDDFKKIVNKDL